MYSLALGVITIIIAFLTTFFFTKYWIKIARKMGLTGKDMNKLDKREVPEAGGIAVIMGFSLAILFYIFFKIFLISTETHLIEIFALLTSILLGGFLGFTDDILGWKIGLRQYQKPLLTIPIALPLMAINAGHSIMKMPFIGSVDFGLIYPLILVPIGIIGVSNGFNLIAGFNGLEAGQGIIILSTLSIISFSAGKLWISLVSLAMVFSLIAFLFFNRYPSKIFPGDSLTYSIGALIAIICILGNMERIGLILILPYFLEFLLKTRSRFQAESFAEPYNGKLRNKYEKIYSINHLILEIKEMEEWKAVIAIWLIEVVFAGIAILTF